jgi:hypothetical protein
LQIDMAAEMEPNINRAKSDELKEWFGTRPPAVAAVMASRIGLRVLPYVIDEPTEGRLSTKQRRLIISAFRYAAIGLLLIKRPSPALDMMGTTLNSIGPRTMLSAGAVIFEAYAAASSVSGVGRGEGFARRAAFRAGNAALFASSVAGADAPWEPIAADAAWIEAGKDPFDLLDRPTWPDCNPPVVSPEPYRSRWNLTRSALDGEDESWKVWTVWYEDRLNGSPSQSDDVEYFRLTLVPNAVAKANDTSDAGQRQWRQEIDANLALLRNDPRKANRIVAKYIAGSEST